MADPRFKNGPLSDLRVIELGTLLAGPFCGQLLGDLGAEVIKVEPPGQGDPLREWGREKAHGKSLWWPVVARNKKSITLDLRQSEGQNLLHELAAKADFLLENFRPGTLEKWNCGWDRLSAHQSAPHHDPRLRVRADRALCQARRFRRDRRGNGRTAPRRRRSQLAAFARRHQHRRFAGGDVCLSRRAVRAALSRSDRVAGR